ncbi:hypothetical protein [Sphaerisporangium corydalis]|uniref:Uncharacterized protein n=1 Tax=Sphaerisporangium corydalis TaxID=1441875 RepID=A0ABV9ERN8_9ACTN|nr:hypothetical protein [Sphaerisporangium corydalis]
MSCTFHVVEARNQLVSQFSTWTQMECSELGTGPVVHVVQNSGIVHVSLTADAVWAGDPMSSPAVTAGTTPAAHFLRKAI